MSEKWSINYDQPNTFKDFELIWFAQALTSTLQEILEIIDIREEKRTRK